MAGFFRHRAEVSSLSVLVLKDGLLRHSEAT